MFICLIFIFCWKRYPLKVPESEIKVWDWFKINEPNRLDRRDYVSKLVGFENVNLSRWICPKPKYYPDLDFKYFKIAKPGATFVPAFSLRLGRPKCRDRSESRGCWKGVGTLVPSGKRTLLWKIAIFMRKLTINGDFKSLCYITRGWMFHFVFDLLPEPTWLLAI